jgi:sulfoxide reductase heme-binding subunit YedZ
LRQAPQQKSRTAAPSSLNPRGAERIAVFRNGNKVHAVSNACRHQGGPLGEGRIIDGCITCPWHGFQYRPEDGRSPEPFTERISTYETQIRDGIVYVNPHPLTPGTSVSPSLIEEATT